MRFVPGHQVEPFDSAGLSVHFEHGRIQHIACCREQELAVFRPAKRAEAAIKIRGKRADLAAFPIAQVNGELVRFVTRTLHREIGQRFAVGRWGGQRIVSAVAGGEVGWRRSVEIRPVNVEIGRDRLVFVGDARFKIETRGIRRPGNILFSAEWLCWRVGGDASCRINAVGRCARAADFPVFHIESENAVLRAG